MAAIPEGRLCIAGDGLLFIADQQGRYLQTLNTYEQDPRFHFCARACRE